MSDKRELKEARELLVIRADHAGRLADQVRELEAERDGLLAIVAEIGALYRKRCNETGKVETEREEMFLADLSESLTTTPAQSLANLQAALVLEYIDSPEHAESLREAATIALEKAVARIGFARLIRMDRRSDEWWRGMNEAERLLLAVAAEYRKTTESETNHE